MKISKEVMELKTARMIDLLMAIPDQERFDHLTLKLAYLGKYGERGGSTALIEAINACIKDGLCYVNNTRSWKRGVIPPPVLKKKSEATPMPFEDTNDELDRFKSRLCAVVQNTEQTVKGMVMLNERTAGLEKLFGGILLDNGNVAQQLDNVSAALEMIRKRAQNIEALVQHLTNELDGAKS